MNNGGIYVQHSHATTSSHHRCMRANHKPEPDRTHRLRGGKHDKEGKNVVRGQQQDDKGMSAREKGGTVHKCSTDKTHACTAGTGCDQPYSRLCSRHHRMAA